MIPVELSCHKRTLCPVVPVVESVSREVVMLPVAENIGTDWVEIVARVLVAVIEVVVAGEGV